MRMRSRRSPIPPRPLYGPDMLRAAWMAGNGASADDIARAIGGTTAQRVRAMLRDHHLTLLRRGEDVLTIAWNASDRRQLNGIADALNRDPGELAALILREALGRGINHIATLIDGGDGD